MDNPPETAFLILGTIHESACCLSGDGKQLTRIPQSAINI